MQEVTLPVEGMSCMHCVKAVENALSTLDGVNVEKVDIGRATVQYDETKVDLNAIKSAIEQEGYSVEA